MAVPENYRLIKLKTGDDLISECFETPEDKNHIVLIRPMQIQIAMKFDGSGNTVPSKLIMTEWLAFSQEDTVALPRENILSFGKPTEQISAIYDREKLRVAELRSKLELKSIEETPAEEKTDEKAQREKARQRKINKRKKMILIQMSVETLLRMLESLGVDIDDEPWKAMLNPPDDDEDDDDDDDDEEENPNLDGTLDLRPDVDGDGLVDPYGNRWPDN